MKRAAAQTEAADAQTEIITFTAKVAQVKTELDDQEIEGAERVIGGYADLAGSRAALTQQARDALDTGAP